MSSRLYPLCLKFLLKFLNYVQAFIGISITIYSLWMLGIWNSRPDLQKLPFPWLVYILMGTGLLFCLVSCTGYLAAGVANPWCLCLYVVLTAVLILFEATFAADLVLNKHRQEHITHDTTGKLLQLHEVAEKHADFFEGMVVSVVCIQAILLLLALILRGTVLNRSDSGDSDIFKETLLDQEFGLSTSSACINSKGIASDTWVSWMKQKMQYALNCQTNGGLQSIHVPESVDLI